MATQTATAAPVAASRAPRLGYRPALDGLRALAIAAVIVFHEGYPVASGGFLGVDLFFVLSGFLITTLLLEEHRDRGHIQLGRFYLRRVLRLYPALVLVLLFCAVQSHYAHALGLRTTATPKAIVTALFYASNVVLSLQSFPLEALNPTWSLALEEQFYLLWPPLLLLLLRARLGPRALLGVALALAAASAAWRWHLTDGLIAAHLETQRVFFGPDTRAEALLLGCALAFGLFARGLPRRGPGWDAVGVVGLAVWLMVVHRATPVIASAWVFRWGLTVSSVAAALVIVGAVGGEGLARVLSLPPLVAIGKISYGIYLWHYPVDWVLTNEKLGLPHGPRASLLRAGVALALAALSYALVERRFLRLKDRLTAAPRPAGAAS